MLPSLLLITTILPLTLAKTSCMDKVNHCQARDLKRPVCGSDGHTYQTRCHLLRAKCNGSTALTVVRKGPCSEWHPCWASGSPDDKLGYDVKCLEDGTYAPMQCHSTTGYCWCVTQSGLPIANTSVRHTKPTCHIVKDKKVKNGRGHRGRKVCGKVEKVKFINKLVSMFNVELCRLDEKEDNCLDDGDDWQKRTVPWKFNTLDTNSDSILAIEEYNGFVSLVKKAVKPQRCAQSFVNICDENKDKNISISEWKSCLVKRPVVKKNKPKRKPFDDSVFGRTVTFLNSQITSVEEPQTDKKEEPEGSNCQADRKMVLSEQADVRIALFIPECTPDGRYDQVQCYKSTGYCWCANKDTGRPIPGTSIKDSRPNCDELITTCQARRKLFISEGLDVGIISFLPECTPDGRFEQVQCHKPTGYCWCANKDTGRPIPRTMQKDSRPNCDGITPLKPMNGCPDYRKKIFFKELKNFFRVQVPSTDDDKFAASVFEILDTNKNKVLERREMRPFRTLVDSFSHPVNRCGKKFPKYCDVNRDRQISLTEWVNCMDSKRQGGGLTISNRGQRKGPNPLETILKPDDE